MLNLGNSEILQIADSVAREKGIQKDVVISAMEQAIAVAGRRKYGQEHNIKAEISKKTGDIQLFRVLEVVENVEDPFTQISLPDAQEKNSELTIGGSVLEPLPPIDLGRVAAQTAKQIIVQKVRDAERDKQYEDFKGRVGEIINGSVKRVEFGNIIIDLGRTEAIIRKDQMIKGEIFKSNDRIKAYIQDVRRETSGPQIFMSRTDARFLEKLFELEVPEVYDKVIQIKAIARDPGSKAKVAVFASDISIDAVGSCVGVRGARVKGITEELNGEKIDVIAWHKDFAQFVINALAPAEISKVVVNEVTGGVEVIVAEDQLSKAIGRKGQNVRLASQLIGMRIDVLTEDQESKKRVDEFNNITELFCAALDIEEMMAQLLAVEGFAAVEQIAIASIEKIASIDGFDEDLAHELQRRAMHYVNEQNADVLSKLEELGVEQELLDLLDNVSLRQIAALAEEGIKTVEDLGEITVAEFKEFAPDAALTDQEIEALITHAKAARA